MRSWFWAGIAVLVCLPHGALGADESEGQPASRIRILNVNCVLEGSTKYKTFAREIQEIIQAERKQDTSLVPGIPLQLSFPSATEKQAPKSRAEKGDGMKAEEHLVAAYKDMEKAARRYSKAQHIDVLLFYSDAVSEKERLHVKNVERKLLMGSLCPLYAGPGMDVSNDVVAEMNADLEARESAPSSQKKKEPPAAKPGKPRTQVAVLNLSYVIKNYKKYQKFSEEMKKAFEPYQQRDKELTKELEELSKSEEELDEIKKKIKKVLRQIEDNKVEARDKLNKRAHEQMKDLYLDIQDSATRYARAHEFDLVLHYNEATTERDYFSPQNIARKMQSGGLMPMYASQGVDISKEVVEALNSRLEAGEEAEDGGSKEKAKDKKDSSR